MFFWIGGSWFLLLDVIIGTSLVTLLLCRTRRVSTKVEWLFPLRGRWLWSLLLGLAMLAYASLAPSFLFFWVKHVQQRHAAAVKRAAAAAASAPSPSAPSLGH